VTQRPSSEASRAIGGAPAAHRSRRRSAAHRRDRVFVLAVVSSLDAALLTAAVVLRGRPAQPQLLAYLIGGMGLSIAFGVSIVLGLYRSRLLREPSRSTSAVIEVVAGLLLIIVRSGRAVQWHPAARVTTRPSPRAGRACTSAQSAMTQCGSQGACPPQADGQPRFSLHQSRSASSSQCDTARLATERKPRLSASEFRFGPIVCS
jgi:hypothetical protein